MTKFTIYDDPQATLATWRKKVTDSDDLYFKYLQNPNINQEICVYRQINDNLNFFSIIIKDRYYKELKQRLPYSEVDRSCLSFSANTMEDERRELPLIYQRSRIENKFNNLPQDPPILNPILFDLFNASIFVENIEKDYSTLIFINSFGQRKKFMIISKDIVIADYKSLSEVITQNRYALYIYFNHNDPEKDKYTEKELRSAKCITEEKEGIKYYEARHKDTQKLIERYGGKIILRAQDQNFDIKFVVKKNLEGKNIFQSLNKINPNIALAFEIKALDVYNEAEYTEVSDKQIKIYSNCQFVITRSEDNNYFLMFVAHLQKLPIEHQEKLSQYSVSDSTYISEGDFNIIVHGIPTDPTNLTFRFKLIYKELSLCWKKISV